MTEHDSLVITIGDLYREHQTTGMPLSDLVDQKVDVHHREASDDSSQHVILLGNKTGAEFRVPPVSLRTVVYESPDYEGVFDDEHMLTTHLFGPIPSSPADTLEARVNQRFRDRVAEVGSSDFDVSVRIPGYENSEAPGLSGIRGLEGMDQALTDIYGLTVKMFGDGKLKQMLIPHETPNDADRFATEKLADYRLNHRNRASPEDMENGTADNITILLAAIGDQENGLVHLYRRPPFPTNVRLRDRLDVSDAFLSLFADYARRRRESA